MATNTFVEIDIPEAINLADYYGIRDDLDMARGIAGLIQELSASPRPDWRLTEPLWTALLVRYARPFKSGSRRKLDNEILSILSDRQKLEHNYFITIRDKHIAHSVNSFEENQPIARYWVERVETEGIESVSCNRNRVVGLSHEALLSMISLCEILLNEIELRIKQEEANVLNFVRSLPYQDVISGKYKFAKRESRNPFIRRPQPRLR